MLEIKDLCKSYGKFKAVDNLNLKVEKGEIFGFVGPNGAGKTTTMKIMAGLLSANSGNILIDGVSAINDAKKIKNKIGYMPDFFGVYDDLKAGEYLEFYASIYGIRGEKAKKVCNDLLELVNLSHKKDAYVDGLSRGMKQRLCLARCLVHEPSLLVLDEPASGMDPRARVEMKDILRTLKDMGKTIIISSHILPELAELCTKIGIIENGKIVIQGTVEEIMKKVYSKNKIEIKVIKEANKAKKILEEFPEINEVEVVENAIEMEFKGDYEKMNSVIKRLIENNIALYSFSEVQGNLEDIFMKVTGGEAK